MNALFNLYRFRQLLKLHFAEQGKSYLIALGLSIGGMLLLMSPILITDYYNDLLFVVHVSALFGVILGSSLFSSTAFNTYNNSSQGIPALMLPASRLEKFLIIWLSNLIFVVLIAVIFYGAHHGLVNLANQNIAEGYRTYQPLPYDIARFFAYSYFLIQGLTFLGSIYFTKNAYIKTMGIFLLMIALLYLFNFLLAYQFSGQPNQIIAMPFTSWTVFTDRNYHVKFPEAISSVVKIFLTLLVVALWYITYVRMKEKEI